MAGGEPKVSVPRVRNVTVPERLLDELDARRAHKLVIVRGPPGSGKTTLVASWLARSRIRAAWYNVDSTDEDPAMVLRYLPQALSRVQRGPAAELGFSTEWASSFDARVRRALRPLLEKSSKHTLVFDDYQNAPSDAPFHAVVAACIEELPDGGRVVLISRGDVPVERARLALHGKVAEIGWSELRLRDDEARRVLEKVNREHLDETAISARLATAGGWVAGLLLPDVGAHGLDAGADYLQSEVLSRLPGDWCRTLCLIAEPDELTAELAATLGGESAPVLLAQLARTGWFVTELSSAGVYRLHDLLRESLRRHARHVLGSEHAAHVSHVARLLEEQGRIDEALGTRLRAGAIHEVANSIERHGSAWLKSGRLYSVSAWLGRLPESIVNQQPWLGYLRAHELAYRQPAESLAVYDRVWQELDAGGEHDGAAIVLGEMLQMLVFSGADFDRARSLIPAALELASDGGPGRAVLLAMVVQVEFIADGDRNAAWTLGQRVLGMFATSPELRPFEAYHKVSMGLIAIDRGDRTSGLALLREADCIERADIPVALQGTLDMACAVALHVSGEFEAALIRSADAARRASDLGFAPLEHHARVISTWTTITMGRFDEARAALDAVERLQVERPLWHGNLQRARAWLALASGDARAAEQYAARAIENFTNCGATLFANMARLTWAAARGELGDSGQRELLAAEARWARERGALISEFTAVLELALLECRSGEPVAAHEALRAAFSLGARHGVLATYTWRRSAVSELCAIAFREGIEPDYARELVDSHDLDAPPGTNARDAWPWRVELSVLGRPRLVVRGTEVPLSELPGAKLRRLLELLALLGGRDVPCTSVVDAIWPDADADRAHQNLEHSLRRLRGWLRQTVGGDPGSDLVVLASGHLSFDGRRVWLDVWSFETELERLRARAATGDDLDWEAHERLLELLWPCFDPLRDSEPLVSRWRTRARRIIQGLAMDAERRGDSARAARWRRELADVDDTTSAATLVQ